MTRAALAALLAAAALAAGCSSSGASKADNPVITPQATTSSAAAPSSAPPSSAPPTVSVAAPSTPASTTAASSTPATSAATSHLAAPPAVQRSTCTKLTVRAIPGGASMGQEIAALQFTNDGSTPCRLVGYPAVTLLRNHQVLGRPAQPSSTAMSARNLNPGDTAESLLHDYVLNCQAPLSDEVRVVAPSSSQTLVRPMQLRACVLRTDRLGAPD